MRGPFDRTFQASDLTNASTWTNQNILIGDGAGDSLTTGAQNTLVGHQAGTTLTTGSDNTALGFRALLNETAGNRSVAIGQDALYSQIRVSSWAVYNTAVGFEAGNDVTTGTTNTLIGAFSGAKLTTGANHVALGYNALGAATTGANNTAIGANALDAVTTGADNVAVGFEAGKLISTGGTNTILGGAAGDAITTGGNNIVIGYNADTSSATASNEIVIGDGSHTRHDLKGIGTGAEVVTIADDAVGTITPPRNGGFASITCEGDGDSPDGSRSQIVFFDVGTSLNISEVGAAVGSSLDVSTSDVSGTTGTDGSVTVAVQSGVLKIENRAGGSRDFQVSFFG